MRLQVADASGVPQGQLEAEVGPMTWRLSDVGRASLIVAASDAKATASMLAFGNRALIEFDNGLPAWGGVVDPDRDWDGEAIRVNLYSAEHVLSYAQTDRGRYFDGVSKGHIFTAVISEAVAAGELAVELGQVWEGGDNHSPDYHFANLLKIVRDSLCERLGAEFVLLPDMTSGALAFRAELYERRGMDKPGVVLLEGANLTRLRLKEQGPIRNSIVVVGEGTDWGDERPISNGGAPLEDAESIAAYGRRAYTEVFPDTSELSTLDATAVRLLEKYAWPRRKWDVGVVDAEPGLFAAYDIGDAVRLQAPSFGFGGVDAMVRIQTREYDPATGFCNLVVEEVV